MDESVVIDGELVSFESKCNINKERYYNNYPIAVKLEKIFITVNVRKKYFNIDKQSNSQLRD